MGWTSYYLPNKNDVHVEVERLFEDKMDNGEKRFDIRMHSKYGSTHYLAVHDTLSDKVHGFIILTQYDGKNKEFYYKDLTEDCGGDYRGVPLKLVNMLSDTDNKYALQWRENVRAWHKRQNWMKKNLKDGAIVKLNVPLDYGFEKSDTFELVQNFGFQVKRKNFYFKLNNGRYGSPGKRWKDNIVAVNDVVAPAVPGYH